MAKDPYDEILEFVRPEARLDLKHMSLDHLVGLSGSEAGLNVLLEKERIIQSVIHLTYDKVEEIAKNALLFLVNVSASPSGAAKLLKYQSDTYNNVIQLFIGYVLNPNKKDADAACMILSNITRQEETLESCVDTFLPYLKDVLNAFVDIDFNKKGSDLDYLAPTLSNLSCSPKIRQWLTTENPYVPLLKLLPFCNYRLSNIRRGGAIGTVRNLSFDSQYHSFLLTPDLDLLTYLLSPIMGNEEYPDDEMDKLPISLQYLPKRKLRDEDVDIRKMVLETLNKLCCKRVSREFLRDNGVYYVLREYHKWEKDVKVRLVCENVVDILIQKEEEVGAEDLSSVEVPEDMVDKFVKMDEEYMNNEQ